MPPKAGWAQGEEMGKVNECKHSTMTHMSRAAMIKPITLYDNLK